MERDGLVALIDVIAPLIGVGAAAMATFRTMIAMTRPSAFKGAGEPPCCYLSQIEIARKRAVAPSRIRRHEAELVSAGLIRKCTMANGARSGHSGCGIFFDVVIARVQEFRELKERLEADRKAHGRLRGMRSSHKRHLKSALLELVETCGEADEVQAIFEAFAQWPSAQALHRMSLDDLAAHEAEANDLCGAALDLLHDLLKSSARPLENERSHIQDTTQDFNTVLCNDEGEAQNLPPATPVERRDATPHGAACCIENKDRAQSSAHKSKLMQQIGGARLYHLCSEDMQVWVNIALQKRSGLDFHSFVIAAQKRLPELGIHPSAWREAVESLGEQNATFCVLITDAKVADPEIPILSPGGYLRGMVRAARTGSLNIIGSLIGLTERNRCRA
ncbi:hypothetical protein P775_00405 [Puniceibacterium antarcticum]|uniref:Uncharacterized protein n=2 Tax=Puniceibacterium antarcticum TaxID=1206336 RepID=A0A2G8RKZ2_9RHOB|nr:hypothetical protein P775_00405 [Puniceibacterium antarcticum]